MLKRQLQQKRQPPVQRFCSSIIENKAEASNYLERNRVRLLPHLLRRSNMKRAKSIRPPPLRLPSPRQAAWMLLQPEKLKDEQRSKMEKLCQLFPQIEKAQELAQEFIRVVCERASNQFNEGCALPRRAN